MMQDVFGRDLAPLARKRLWLFDLDGTVYEGDRLFEGTLPLLDAIRALGGRYIFLTNNSSRDITAYLEKVRAMGIDADEDSFYTSVDATVAFLEKNHPGELVYCMGTRAMVRGLTQAGIRVTERDDEGATVALIGYDTELTYEKLIRATNVIATGVPYYGANCDLVCPAAPNYVPDCGSFARMLECSTGRMPRFLGKPEATMVLPVLEKYGVAREDAVIVGDRIYTDIALGPKSGIDTVCVLTGESSLEDIEASDVEPTWVVSGVELLAEVLAG